MEIFHCKSSMWMDGGARGRFAVLLALGAMAFLASVQPAAAAEAARAAVRKSPSWADAWLTLGRACLNAGQFAQASQALRQAVALEPSFAEEADGDIASAERLQLEQDERTMTVGGASLVLQQWLRSQRRAPLQRLLLQTHPNNSSPESSRPP